MKLLLSSETLKMHDQQAKAQGVTVDDIVKREALISESQTLVKFRNEKIEGEKATLEVENSFGGWDTVPFVFEEGQWKIDKKGFADQMMREIEESQRQIEDAINQGRQGDPVTPGADPAMSLAREPLLTPKGENVTLIKPFRSSSGTRICLPGLKRPLRRDHRGRGPRLHPGKPTQLFANHAGRRRLHRGRRPSAKGRGKP